MARFFKRAANRHLVYFSTYGFVPLASPQDDTPEFLTDPPRKVGDNALIRAEGKTRLVILERAGAFAKYRTDAPTFLVDLGPYRKYLRTPKTRAI